ncbi:MAG: hypothetical protein ACP6IY_20590 [Promethearchaeia archaeon]
MNVIQELTETAELLLRRVLEVKKQELEDSIIFELKNLGYFLNIIKYKGYLIEGIFTKINFTISIPCYIIHEDILEQLRIMIEEYYNFISNNNNSLETDSIENYLNRINWKKIINSKLYAELFLETSVELLYEKLYNSLLKKGIINNN